MFSKQEVIFGLDSHYVQALLEREQARASRDLYILEALSTGRTDISETDKYDVAKALSQCLVR